MMQTLMNNSVVVLALALVMLALESSAFVVPTDDTYTNDYGFDYTTTVVKSAVGLYVLRKTTTSAQPTAIISSLFPLIFLLFLMSKHVRARALSLPFSLFLPLRQVC